MSQAASFQIASASVLGRDHVGPGKNNQDAVCVLRRERCPDGYMVDALIAVVCDGCGSGSNSEVGAQIGARLMARSLSESVMAVNHEARFEPLERVAAKAMAEAAEHTLVYLRVLAQASVGSDPTAVAQFVKDYLLFTIVGAFVIDRVAWTFSLGDGVVYRNGERVALTPANDRNAPAYLAYKMIPKAAPQDGLEFVIHGTVPASDVSSILVGTDGVEALVASAEQRMPGKPELVGTVDRLWTEDRFFQNKDALRRHLALVNRDWQAIDWKAQAVAREHGSLKDDTSLVVIRRPPS